MSFHPGTYSDILEIKNKDLYLTDSRTFGATYDILADAIKRARFDRFYTFRYGEDGFALILPVEQILENGKQDTTDGRFAFAPDTSSLDFRKVTSIWNAYGDDLSFRFRIMVLLITANPVTKDGISGGKPWHLIDDVESLPQEVRPRKWKTEPMLRVLVYEFKTVIGSPKAVLFKRGESNINAKAHILDSGLWTAKQLK
jgi:hypothetical protein